jgi:hypothetical protein
MLASMAGIGIGAIFGMPGYTTMICETVLLESFAVAWIIKSGFFFK